MAFRRKQNHHHLELTGLIDIVFILLVFFLVAFSVSVIGETSDSTTYSEIDLPKIDTDLVSIEDDVLENLMIQIVPDTVNYLSTRKVFVLWPSFDRTKRISRIQAFMNAQRDSLFAVFPVNFLALPDQEFTKGPACKLIAGSIKQYIELEKFHYRNTHPKVEVRAEKSTEFKILNFIMEQCGSYNDAIPQIIIRTGL